MQFFKGIQRECCQSGKQSLWNCKNLQVIIKVFKFKNRKLNHFFDVSSGLPAGNYDFFGKRNIVDQFFF